MSSQGSDDGSGGVVDERDASVAFVGRDAGHHHVDVLQTLLYRWSVIRCAFDDVNFEGTGAFQVRELFEEFWS